MMSCTQCLSVATETQVLMQRQSLPGKQPWAGLLTVIQKDPMMHAAWLGFGRRVSAPACVLAGVLVLLMGQLAQELGTKAQLTHVGQELRYLGGGILHLQRPWLQAWEQACGG